MIKYGMTNKNVIAILTPDEFKMLTGQVADQVPDTRVIDLSSIQAAIDLRDKNMPIIKELVEAASKLQENKV
jgi:hypothetical protein